MLDPTLLVVLDFIALAIFGEGTPSICVVEVR
jgi:hypothetical protein